MFFRSPKCVLVLSTITFLSLRKEKVEFFPACVPFVVRFLVSMKEREWVCLWGKGSGKLLDTSEIFKKS